MNQNKDFKIFVNDFIFTYGEFYLNRILHKKIGTKLYHKFKLMWDIILIGLEKSYIIGLARAVERPRQLEETISIYSFFDYKLKKHEETVFKIRNWRNKAFAHLDAKQMREKLSFLKANKLTPAEIKKLFDTIVDVIEKLNLEFRFYKKDIRKVFNEVEKNIEKKCKIWLAEIKKSSEKAIKKIEKLIEK